MKKVISLGPLFVFMILASALIIACGGGGGGGVSCEYDSTEIIFVDPGLEATVRDAIGKPGDDPILQSDLCGLTYLDASIDNCKSNVMF